MIISFLKFLKCLLFGCEQDNINVKEVEKIIENLENEVKEIENEDYSSSDIVDHFNKK
jgi:transcriptional regulator NrdR family protein